MFNVNYKELTLSFNEFHDVSAKDMPQYGEYCLLELKTGAYTAGRTSLKMKRSTGSISDPKKKAAAMFSLTVLSRLRTERLRKRSSSAF